MEIKMNEICPICSEIMSYSHIDMFGDFVYYCPQHGKFTIPVESI